MIFTIDLVEAFVQQHYNMRVEASFLQGYDEQNFLLRSKTGEKYILKIANEEHGVEFLDAQVRMLQHLAKKGFEAKFPEVLPNEINEPVSVFEKEGTKYYIRILTYLEGSFWVNQDVFSESLYESLGEFLGEMDQALNGFSHVAMHKNYLWDVSKAAEAGQKLSFIKEPSNRRLADYFLLQFETEVLPTISSLRQGYIHNDANDYNVLIRDGKVAGLIDFGDIIYKRPC